VSHYFDFKIFGPKAIWSRWSLFKNNFKL